MRLLLTVCGADWVDVARQASDKKAGAFAVMQYFKNAMPDGTYPVLFPPILKHGDNVFHQTIAIFTYVGKLFHLLPEDPVDLAHCYQIMLTTFDALHEAELSYHPVEKSGSYAAQHEAAERVIARFMNERLPLFMKNLELALQKNNNGASYYFGDKLSIADVVVYQFIRGYRSSQKEAFEKDESIPCIKKLVALMETRDDIGQFLASDRCTAMESESASPLAEAPNVQVNSFM